MNSSLPIIFTDIDGTICFHKELNHITCIESLPQGKSKVHGPDSTQCFEAHDVSTSSYTIYFAEETRRRLRELQPHFRIVLATGGRPSTCQKRAHLFNFAEAFIAENGGVIYDQNFNRDEDWWQHLAPERALLEDVKKYIESYQWKLDADGRSSAIRVRLKDNPHKNSEKFARLCEAVRLPPGLQSTINLENLDIILAGAGKDKAVAYYLETRASSATSSHGIGDDINDAAFLRVCQYQYVLQSAFPPVIQEAQAKGWFISKKSSFEGIHEILERIKPSH
jgi:hydroxymethylpyrimidine pyrophosphatase-like HAD family hydrolase